MKRKDMIVEEVMKKGVITARRGTTLRELMGIFGKFNFHVLPVIEKDNKLVGVIALVGALNPPKFLQFLIVFASGGVAVVLLVPLALALYWPRFNSYGAVASMLGGLVIYLGGFIHYEKNVIKPFLPALGACLIIAIVVTKLTPRPSEHLVKRYFYK